MIFAILIAVVAATGIAVAKKNQAIAQYNATPQVTALAIYGNSRPDFHPTAQDVRSGVVQEGAPTVYNPGDPGNKVKGATGGGAPAPAGIPPGAPGGSPSGSGGSGTGSTGGRGNRYVL